MRNAECGMSGRVSLDDRPSTSTPHSAFPIPRWAGRGGAVKIAVVFDTLHPDRGGTDHKKEGDAKVEEAGHDVGRALRAPGDDGLMVCRAEQIRAPLERPD